MFKVWNFETFLQNFISISIISQILRTIRSVVTDQKLGQEKLGWKEFGQKEKEEK